MVPFRIEIPPVDLDDPRQRPLPTRCPTEPPEIGRCCGVPLDYPKGIGKYRRDGLDWRVPGASPNAFPRFSAESDSQSIHSTPKPPPPRATNPAADHHPRRSGSAVEIAGIIQPLTETRAHGGDAAVPVHAIASSPTGFGISIPVQQPG